jgi:hypothetical protein
LKPKLQLTIGACIETYSAFCRNYGTHSTPGAGGYRCWNEEALKPMNDHLVEPWSRLETELQRQLEIAHTSVSEILHGTVVSHLGSYHDLFGAALGSTPFYNDNNNYLTKNPFYHIDNALDVSPESIGPLQNGLQSSNRRHVRSIEDLCAKFEENLA